MAQRRVIRGGKKSFRARLQRFLFSFTPTGFKRYWLSPEGARRAGKIGGMGLLLLFLVFLYFAKDLPSPSKINAQIGSQTTIFYDRTGITTDDHKLAEIHGDKNRSIIGFDQMPDSIKHATVSIEDKDFYKHGAFSVFGIGRAFTGIIFRDPSKGGGSTITQQYVKNALLSPDRTLTRKIKELILSLEIEQLYKKDDILKLYLNEIPYGSQAYGIKAAANTYFSYQQDTGNHKKGEPLDPKDLSLQQASLLAALPQAPSYYSPYGSHVDALLARQHTVLDRMADQHYITKKEAEDAKLNQESLAAIINPAPKLYANVKAPHFVQYVEETLENKYGTRAVETGGWKVITTIDLDKQKQAEEAVTENMRQIRAGGGSNAAVVAGDPKTGQILAMVGSYNFSDPKYGAFNVATAARQPGSSFKPFVYSTLFAKNKDSICSKTGTCPTYGPGTTLYDVPTDFGGGYKPKNYSGSNYGVVSARQALGGSLNIPAVKALYLAGIPESLQTAHNMGITTLKQSPDNYGLSLVLGSGEVKLVDMVNAYESFATGGIHHDPTPILKIVDAKGNTFENHTKADSGKRVLDPQIAYLISSILSDNPNRAFIFGNLLALPNGRPAAVKTGTTEFYNDAWTMGYTPSLVAGVWVGNNDNSPMSRQASAIAAPVWKSFMIKALAGTPNESFTQPSGIKTVTLDKDTGKLPGPGTKATRTDIFPSWYNPAQSGGTKTATVDKVSGKLATSCTPDAAKQQVTSSEIHAEIPSNDPSYNRWEPPVQALAKTLGYGDGTGGAIPTDNDDVHHCDDIKPTVKVTATGSGPIHITATVTSGTHTANKLDIYLDDQVISTQGISGSTTYSFDYSPTVTGSHTIKAVVTDDALYSGSDETTVTITTAGGGGGGPFDLVGPANLATVNHNSATTFSWTSGGSGVYTLHLSGPGGSPSYGSIFGTSKTINAPSTPGSYIWWVTSGGQSTSSRILVVR